MKLLKGLSVIALLLLLLSGCNSGRKLMEWPKYSKKETIVHHNYFTLNYDNNHEIAKWTAYSLTKEETHPCVDRSYNYLSDPKLENYSANDNDYNKSGYDRGHLIPARDMMFNKLAQVEVNYISNITPQDPGFNRGIWRVLERNVRRWANEYDSVMIVTGPVLKDSLPVIGIDNKISVPESFYKTILVYNDTIKTAIAFHIPNRKCTDTNIFDYAISIDSLESITHLDFYPKIPGKFKQIEDTVVLIDWIN